MSAFVNPGSGPVQPSGNGWVNDYAGAGAGDRREPGPPAPQHQKRHRWPRGPALCPWAHRCRDCGIPQAVQKRTPRPCGARWAPALGEATIAAAHEGEVARREST